MKRFYAIHLLLFTVLFAGCSEFELNVNHSDRDCEVSFNLMGEISTSDMPITKSSTNDLYLVQTYSNNSCYGTGVFDSPNKIKINLKSGASYDIIISVLRNGKDRLGNNYSSVNNSILPTGTFYSFLWNNNMWWAINYYYYKSVNLVYYYSGSTSTNLNTYSGFELDLDCKHAKLETSYPQCDDWFYGEINGYSPTGEYETLNLELKRVGFKLKYELSGVTDGEVTVKVYNSTKTFIENTTSTSTYSSDPVFFAFYEARNAWLYADDYMENFTLSVSWLRGIGITEDYGTKTIQLKRNCLNNIKINLGSNDQNAGMNLTVESESTIGAESITIPVE